MAKSNIRSFRYSDEIAVILEGIDGNSLNEKFENLVYICYQELPKIQLLKEELVDEINKLEGKESALKKRIMKFNQTLGDLDSLKTSMKSLEQRIDKTCNT